MDKGENMANKKLSAAERFANLVNSQKQDGSLQIDEAKLELSEQIFNAMESEGVTEAELARRLGTSRAYINKVLQGATNFTIETLVKIGLALDCEFRFEFIPNNQQIEKEPLDEDVIYVEVEEIREPEYMTPFAYPFDTIRNVVDLNNFVVGRKRDISISSAANQELALS